jgi:hypothetical protein
MADWIPAQGYVFDGLVFQRATVKKDLIVNSETGQLIPIQPALAVWYTRREMQNAVAALEKQCGSPLMLISLAPTPELMGMLKSQRAKAMSTRDHILRMLTNGRARVLGRPLTTEEWDQFGKQADRLLARLEKAQIEAQQAVA